MSISVADPTRLPTASIDAEYRLGEFNSRKLTGQTWTPIGKRKLPTVVRAVGTPTGIIYASPGKQPPGLSVPATTAQLQATCYYGNAKGVYLEVPGEWWIYLDSATAENIVVYDDISTAAVLQSLGLSVSGGASGLSADVRDFDADADVASTLNGIVTNTRLAVWNPGSAVWTRAMGAGVSTQLEGQDLSSRTAMIVWAMLAGKDSGATVNRQIEGRDFVTLADIDDTLIGLVTNSRAAVYDVDAADWGAWGAAPDADASFTKHAVVLQGRREGYYDALRSRTFVLTHYTPTVQFQATVGYAATAPAVLIVNAGTNDMIVDRVDLRPLQAITAASLHAHIKTDPDNRYSASTAPTSYIPSGGFKSTNRDGSLGAAYTPTRAVYYDGVTAITATAEDNDECAYGTQDFRDNEDPVVFDMNGGAIVPPSGSLLIYVWSTGGGEDFMADIHVRVFDAQ